MKKNSSKNFKRVFKFTIEWMKWLRITAFLTEQKLGANLVVGEHSGEDDDDGQDDAEVQVVVSDFLPASSLETLNKVYQRQNLKINNFLFTPFMFVKELSKW